MRIKAAKAKIKALSQSEEPLTIVSPALHPSSSTKQEEYRPLFHDKHGLPIATIAVNGGFNREYGLEGTLELFQFFSEENCDYPSTSKPTDKFPKTKDGTYLENLLQTANHPAPGTHLASGTKSDELPRPPPSLLPKHFRSRESEDVTIESDLEWLTGGECLARMHEVVVTKRTLDAIALAKEQNRSLWRVSSTLFAHIASDAILKPLGHFAETPDAHSYPPICAGDYVEQELSLINLKGKDGV